MNRSLHAQGEDGTFPALGFISQFLTEQNVMSAPSVFNFYLPDFSPNGELGDLSLAAPEFQITNDSTVVGITNLMAFSLYGESSVDTPVGFADIVLDMSEFTAVADDADALVAQIDLVFFGGAMSDGARQVLLDALSAFGASAEDRARLALYLALVSPDSAVAGASS